MKVINNYHKKLHCQVGSESIGIDPNQILTVEDSFGEELIKNEWIGRVVGINIPVSTPRSEISQPMYAVKYSVPQTLVKDSIEEKKEKPVEEKEIEKVIDRKAKEFFERSKRKNPIRKKIKVDKKYLKD